MRELPDPGAQGLSPSGAGRGPTRVLSLPAHITAAEAIAVFRRKIPRAEAQARAVVHPFWWSSFEARTRGLLSRSTGPGRQVEVLTNAVTGRGFIADFTPDGAPADPEDWHSALPEETGEGRVPDAAAVSRSARSLVRTQVVKTVKLGMRIDLRESAPARGVLKPNWLVTGGNGTYTATILVDGLDSSHYIIRVEKHTA